MLVRLITILTSLLLLVVVLAVAQILTDKELAAAVLAVIEILFHQKLLVVEAQVSLPCLVLLEIIRLQLVLVVLTLAWVTTDQMMVVTVYLVKLPQLAAVLVEQKLSMPAWAMTVVLVAVTWVIKTKVVTEQRIKVSEVEKILVVVEEQAVVVLEQQEQTPLLHQT
tara:strand:- start:148 stop:645 length:498 start_codon:yes stop_codon:yes gene_type:complete